MTKTTTLFFTLLLTLCCRLNVNAQQLKLQIVNVQHNACNGFCTGSADADASGGKSPYTYLWSNGKTSESAIQLCAGSYTCVVTDNRGRTATASVVITEAKKLELQLTSTKTTCGKTDGTATVAVTGGEGPYKFSWNTNPAQTTATANNLAAGSYTCKVTDKNGCTNTGTVEVKTGQSAITINVSSNDVKCAGEATGSATATVTPDPGNLKYSWNTTPVQTTATATALTSGSYMVTITEASGCTATKTVEIKQPKLLQLTFDIKNADCGSDNGKATASCAGGVEPYTFSWNTTPVQTTATLDKLKAGTYTCTVTDKNNCAHSATATIKITSTLVATITAKDATCFNTASGSATVNVTGGSGVYTYKWNTNPVQTNATANNLKAGNYEVVVTDPAGCSTKANVTIKQPVELVTTVKTTTSACNKATGTAVITVAGGTPGYAYSWNTNPVQTTAAVKDLNIGNYLCTITDKNGCTAVEKILIEPTSGPKITVSSTALKCYGDSNGTATVTVTQGIKPYSYSWSTQPVQTTATATGLKAKAYTVTVKDSNSCATKAEVLIKGPNRALTATFNLTSATCGGADGSATVNANGGTPDYTYAWSTSPVQTTAKADKLVAGIYTCTITDKNGCTLAEKATIKSTGTFSVNTSATFIKCYGDSNGTATATINPAAGTYTYKWNTSPVQSTATAANLKAGNYAVTVTDNKGCEIVTTVEVKQADKIKLLLSSTNATCGAADGTATVNPSGGDAPYTYQWNTTPVQVTATANNLTSGTYNVIVKSASGCNVTEKVIVSQTITFTLTVTAKNASCFGKADGFAKIDVTGGVAPYTYLWNTNPPQTSGSIVNLAAGSYGCVVTDAKGCINSGTVKIGQPEPLSVKITPKNVTICKDQPLILKSVSSGGTAPYGVKWVTGETTTEILVKPLLTTIYTANVTDANGCISVDTSTVTVGANTAAIAGKAYYNTATPIDSGKVYLYDASQSGKLIPKDSTYTDQFGMYNLSGIISGSYKVMVTPKKKHSFLAGTYHAEGYTWDSARVVSLNCGDKYTADIALDSLPVNAATAKISGKLIADKDYGYLPSGTGVKGASINLVLQPGNRLIASTATDAAGAYTFSNIPATPGVRNYYIYVNVPGYSQQQTYVLPLTDNEVVQARNYAIGSKTIYLLSSAIADNAAQPQVALTAYPNPYSSITTISYELQQASNVTLNIYNVLGERVQVLENGTKQAGKHLIPFSAEQVGLSRGMYIVKLQVGENSYALRLIELQ